jgi:hypothetical protein
VTERCTMSSVMLPVTEVVRGIKWEVHVARLVERGGLAWPVALRWEGERLGFLGADCRIILQWTLKK